MTETNANKRRHGNPRRNGAHPRVARRGAGDASQFTQSVKVALVHERATPRAQTLLNTRARVLVYTDTRIQIHDDNFTLVITLESTLVYTLELHTLRICKAN